jgi:hypothetical protein
MQSERITFLASPEAKQALAARASASGLSIGEYVRRRALDEDEVTPAQEAELAALVAEVNIAIPRMAQMLDEMSVSLRRTHEEVDRVLREAGIRT